MYMNKLQYKYSIFIPEEAIQVAKYVNLVSKVGDCHRG